MRNMRIIKGIGGFYYVSDNEHIFECKARGKFRNEGIKPMIGDYVELADNDTVISEVLPRKNALTRPAVSNVDQVLIVLASTNPKPDLFLIDKLILQAKIAGAETVICVNKEDLEDANNLCKIYQRAGLKTFSISAKERTGIDILPKILKNKTTVLAGASGVGKSTILQALGIEVASGIVSKIGRGKHTTRHNELFELVPNTYIIDTAGFSVLDITDLDKHEIRKYWHEFDGYTCKFDDCLHLPNTTCEVYSAYLNGKIAKSRYDSYLRLVNLS